MTASQIRAILPSGLVSPDPDGKPPSRWLSAFSGLMAATKRTPSVRKAILDAVRAGNYQNHAAGAAGIDESTLYRWLEEDRDFAQALAQARDDATATLVRYVESAAASDWRAGAWLLERTRAGQFRESKELEHSGSLAIDTLLLGEPDEAA